MNEKEKKIDKKIECFVSSSGSKLYYPIEFKWSEDDKCHIPYFGKPINRYEMIQASAPSCDINYIVKRALAGDYSALNVNLGSFGDVSNMPDNLNDLNELKNSGLKNFNNLDPSIKSLFNNDFSKFKEAYENNTLNSIINDFIKSKTAPKQEIKEEKKEKKVSEN